MATTSKSPRRVVCEALAVGRESLPAYAHKYAPKKFTQPQLFACLVLKEFLKTDYRGLTGHLNDAPSLREAIGLKATPHYTTVQKAAQRLLKTPLARRLLASSLRRACRRRRLKRSVRRAAVDSSGFDAHHASSYFVRRCAKGQKSSGQTQSLRYRRFPKLAIVTDCDSHFALAVHFEQGPSPDFNHFGRLLLDATDRFRIHTLYADAGYDAEWVHEVTREEFAVRAIVPAGIGRPTVKPPTGRWRRWMKSHLQQTGYGQRWQVETVFSMIKRRLGDTLHARTHHTQRRAAWLKVLAHNILLLRRQRVFYRALPSPLSIRPL